MGLGDILSGLSAVAGGALEGQQNRRELERRARQQLLAEQLQQAAIARQTESLGLERERLGLERSGQDLQRQNIQSEITRREAQTRNEADRIQAMAKQAGYQIHINPDGTVDYIPKEPTQQAQGDAGIVHGGRVQPPPPPLRIGTDAAGNTVVIDPRSATARPVEGAGKPTTPAERLAGSQAITLDDSVNRLDRIARYHPQAFKAAIAFIRAQHHGHIGNLIMEARAKLSDPDALEAVQAYSAYLFNAIPNSRPTSQILQLETDASLPAWGSDPSTWKQSLDIMRARARDLRAKAGRAAPPESGPPSRFTGPR